MKSLTARTSLVIVAFTFVLSGCSKWNPFNTDAKLIVEAEELILLTEDFPPYNYGSSGSVSGVSVEVLDLLFSEVGINHSAGSAEVMDWSTAYQQTLDEAGTLLFSMVKTDERADLFKWLGPIAPHKEVIIAAAGSGIKINSDADLSQYDYGVVAGYPSYDLLRSKGVDPGKIHEYESISSLYDALLAGDIRCISYSEQANQLVLGGRGISQDDYTPHYTLKVDQLYFAFHKSTSGGLINLLQSTLNQISSDIQDDGSTTLEKILNRYAVILHEEDDITDEMVTSLVQKTAQDLESDYGGTIAKINQQQAPYRDAGNAALYAFVYDTDLTIVGHAANSNIVGLNLKGKPDASGKLFRDEILAGALENERGWVDYIYTKPDKSGLFQKTTYYQLVTASNGAKYIVCAGRYK